MQPNDDTTNHPEHCETAEDVPTVMQQSESHPTEPQPQTQTADPSGSSPPWREPTWSGPAESLKMLASLRWWLRASNIVIAAATVATTVVTFWQWESLEDANIAARKAADAAAAAAIISFDGLAQTQRATRAAEVAATAAENQLPIQLRQLDLVREQIRESIMAAQAQLEHERDMLRADQRAWLSLTYGGVTTNTTNDVLRVAFPLENVGRTPAHRTLFRAAPFLSDVAPTLEEINRRFAQEQWQFLGAVFPSEQRREPFATTDMRPEQVTQYRAKRARLFVYVELRYCDVFKRPHWIGRCGNYGNGESSWTLCGTTGDEDGSQPAPDYKCE